MLYCSLLKVEYLALDHLGYMLICVLGQQWIMQNCIRVKAMKLVQMSWLLDALYICHKFISLPTVHEHKLKGLSCSYPHFEF
jgi:hypothetical protein